MRRTVTAFCAAAALLAGRAALADCRTDVAALGPQVEKVPASRTKELLAFDMKRARQELGEGDEDECNEAVEHAHKLLQDKE